MGLKEKLSGTVGSMISLRINRFKSAVLNPQKAYMKVFSEIRKKISSVIKLIFKNPDKLEDYIHVGKRYISYSIIAKGILGVVLFAVLFSQVIFPFVNGRLWPASITVNTREYHEFSGNGKVYREDGTLIYKGEMSRGTSNGIGEVYDENGDLVYRGNFQNNMYSGEGEMFGKNQKLLYKGEFASNLYNGQGQMYYYNGEVKFNGIFESGEFKEGVEYYNNGKRKYNGTYENGLYNGQGRLYGYNDSYSDESMIYTGEFKNGLYDGEGKLYDETSGRLLYNGNFLRGIYQGAGVLYGKNGQEVFRGNFYNGDIDYLSFCNATDSEVRQSFKKESDTVLLDNSYLLVYEPLSAALELSYADTDKPMVIRVRLWGEQNINGITPKMTLKQLKEQFGGQSYTEYELFAEESECFISQYTDADVSEGKILYSVKYIFDNFYVRAYSDSPEGKIYYIETGEV